MVFFREVNYFVLIFPSYLTFQLCPQQPYCFFDSFGANSPNFDVSFLQIIPRHPHFLEKWYGAQADLCSSITHGILLSNVCFAFIIIQELEPHHRMCFRSLQLPLIFLLIVHLVKIICYLGLYVPDPGCVDSKGDLFN